MACLVFYGRIVSAKVIFFTSLGLILSCLLKITFMSRNKLWCALLSAILIVLMQTPPKSSPAPGDSLSFSPDPNWDPSQVNVSTIDVSRWEKSNKYVKVLSNVLTEKECNDIIQLSEQRGYEQALVNVGYKQIKMLDVRNNDRCIIDSPITMDFVWQRITQFCGDDPNLMQAAFSGESNLNAVGLNERMRILRYDPGTYFSPHNDGCYQRGWDMGATRLLNHRDESEGFDVIPATGSVLLFQHDVYHEGSILKQGRKYALRTDVMYTEKGPGHEYSTNPIVLK